MANQVFAFEVSVIHTDWRQTINARSAGQAKAEYWRDVCESWPSIPFTAVRCRKLGAARDVGEFQRIAEGRGMPAAHCGARVRVGSDEGVIVGYNGCANFDVLFDAESRYPNQRLNVHPASVTLLTGGSDGQ